MGATPGPLDGGAPSTSSDAFVAVFDGSGALQWVRELRAAPAAPATPAFTGAGAAAVAVDPSGAVWIGGAVTEGSLPGATFSGVGSDGFVARYDPAGAYLWGRQFGGGTSSQVTALALDASGSAVASENVRVGPPPGARARGAPARARSAGPAPCSTRPPRHARTKAGSHPLPGARPDRSKERAMAGTLEADAGRIAPAPSVRRPIDWRLAAVLLGAIGVIAVALQGPIGVSTAFVTTEAAAVSAVAGPQAAAANAYWKKIGTALSPEWVFVVAMIVGALAASVVSGTRSREDVPGVWRERFGARTALRFSAAFGGGFLLLFGARLAGGCTSGHIISGTSQLALSGMVFAGAVFASAVPFARALYGRSRS